MDDSESEETQTNIQNENAFGDQMPLHSENYDKRKVRMRKMIFFGLVGIMVSITIIIAFTRGIAKHVSYFLLGFSIICITLVEGALMWLLRLGQFDRQKEWFIYFVGICIIIESIFTDVLLFD